MINKKNIFLLFLICIGIYSFFLSIKSLSYLYRIQDFWLISLNEPGYDYNSTSKLVTKLKAEENVSIVLWKNSKSLHVQNPNLNNSGYVDGICYYGAFDLIYPEVNNICNNKMECVIDKYIANTLYGSTDIIGEAITVENQKYIIEHIIEGESGTIIRLGTEKDNFDILSVPRGSFKSIQELEQMLFTTYSIDGTIINLELLLSTAVILVLILPTCIFSILFVALLQQIKSNNNSMKKRTIYFIIILVLVFLFYHAVLKNLVIPSGILVNKFSDFEAWSFQLNKLKKQIFFLVQMKKNEPILSYWNQFYKTCILSFWSLLLLIIVQLIGKNTINVKEMD